MTSRIRARDFNERGRQLRRPRSFLFYSRRCFLPPKALHERAKPDNETLYPAFMVWLAVGQAIKLIKTRRGPFSAMLHTWFLPKRVDCSWEQRLGCNHRSDQKG